MSMLLLTAVAAAANPWAPLIDRPALSPDQQQLVRVAMERVQEVGDRWMSCGVKAAVLAYNRDGGASAEQLAQDSIDGCGASRKEMEAVVREVAQPLAPGRNIEADAARIVAYERQEIVDGLTRTIRTATAK